jgi:hypothetical protein
LGSGEREYVFLSRRDAACSDYDHHDLKEQPVLNDNVADDEDGGLIVDASILVLFWEGIDPCLSSRDTEHGNEGPVELHKVIRRFVGE